jgi:hypothetical protein
MGFFTNIAEAWSDAREHQMYTKYLASLPPDAPRATKKEWRDENARRQAEEDFQRICIVLEEKLRGANNTILRLCNRYTEVLAANMAKDYFEMYDRFVGTCQVAFEHFDRIEQVLGDVHSAKVDEYRKAVSETELCGKEVRLAYRTHLGANV